MGGSSSRITNTVVSETALTMLNDIELSSVVNANVSMTKDISGDDNVMLGDQTAIVMVSNAATSDAQLDANLASSLASEFKGKLEKQNLAVLGALHGGQEDVVQNYVRNSIAAEVSNSTIQRCLINMNIDMSMRIRGNSNVMIGDQTATATATQECMNRSAGSAKLASKVQSWADESLKVTTAGPLDSLFDMVGDIGFYTVLGIAAGGLALLLLIIFVVVVRSAGKKPVAPAPGELGAADVAAAAPAMGELGAADVAALRAELAAAEAAADGTLPAEPVLPAVAAQALAVEPEAGVAM
jgi:hypothetical protein